MKKFTVIVSPIVSLQIHEQVQYIALDSIDNALAWEDRLLTALNSVGRMPGHAIDEEVSERVGYPIRKIVFERTYIIHYRVNDAAVTVEILNFRHGSRLPWAGEL